MKITVRFHCESCKKKIGDKLLQDILYKTQDYSNLVCEVEDDAVVVNGSFESHIVEHDTIYNNGEIVIVHWKHFHSVCTANKIQTFIVQVKMPKYHFITLHFNQSYMILLDSFQCTNGLEIYPELECEFHDVIREFPDYVVPVEIQKEIDEGYIHAFMNSLTVYWAQCLKSEQTFQVFLRNFNAIQRLQKENMTGRKHLIDQQNNKRSQMKRAIKSKVCDVVENGKSLEEIKGYVRTVWDDFTKDSEVYVERKYAKHIADEFLLNLQNYFEKQETIIFDLRSILHKISNIKDIKEPFKTIETYELLQRYADLLTSKRKLQFLKRFYDVCLRNSMSLKTTEIEERDFLQELQKQILRIYFDSLSPCADLKQCLESAMKIPIDTQRAKHFLWELSRTSDQSFSRLRKLAVNLLKNHSQILVQFVNSIIIKFNKGVTISFHSENGLNVLKCEGIFVDMQTMNTEVEKKRSLFDECSQVEVQADLYFFLNCSVSWQGKNVILVTNQFIVDEINENYTIDVSGKHGTPLADRKAKNGTASFIDGLAGEPGNHGESGGNVQIIADSFSNKSHMTILSTGGNGSYGQEGGDGSNGIEGVDGIGISEYEFNKRFPDMAKFWTGTVKTNFKAFKEENILISKSDEYASGIFKDQNNTVSSEYYVKGVTDDNHMIEYGCWYNRALLSWTMFGGLTNRGSYCICFGQPGSGGTPGGNGGKGGPGGKGGFEGKVDIRDWNGKKVQAIEIRCYAGQCGSDGKDGRGGKGGKNGKNGNDRAHICPGQRSATCVYTGHLKIVSYDRSSNFRSYCPNRKKYIGVTQKALEYPSLQRCQDGMKGKNKTRVNSRNKETSRTKKTPIVFSKVQMKYQTIDFRNAYHDRCDKNLNTCHMTAEALASVLSDTPDRKIIKCVEELEHTTDNFNPRKAISSEKTNAFKCVKLSVTLSSKQEKELMRKTEVVKEAIKKGSKTVFLEKELCTVFDSLDQIAIHKSFVHFHYEYFIEFINLIQANFKTRIDFNINYLHNRIMVNFKFYVLETIDDKIRQHIKRKEKAMNASEDTIQLIQIRLKGFYEQLISDVISSDDVLSLKLIESDNEKKLDDLIEDIAVFVRTIPLFHRIPQEFAVDMTDIQDSIEKIDLSDLHRLSTKEKKEIFLFLTSVYQSSMITETPLEGFTKDSNVSQQMTEIKEKVAQIQTSLLKASGKTCNDPDTYHKLTKICQTQNTEKNGQDILLSNIASLCMEYSTATPNNGDCFFEAISDQLIRLDRQHQSAAELRDNVVTFCRQQPTLQREDGLIDLKNFVEGSDLDSYLDKMSRRGEWADHVIVIAMAAYLQAEILVITSSTNELDGNIIWISSGDANQDVVLLGHIFETHYQSLRPCVIDIPKDNTLTMFRNVTRKRKPNYRANQEPAVRAKTIRATESASSTTSTSLYSRLGMVPQTEVSQKLSLESARKVTGEILTQAHRTKLSSGHNFQKVVDDSENKMEDDDEMEVANEDLIGDIQLQSDLASDINDLLEWAKILTFYKDEVCCIIQKLQYIPDESVSLFNKCLKQRLITQGCQVTGEVLFWFLMSIFENEKYVDRGKYLRIIATKKQDEWMAESIIHKIVSRSELSDETHCRKLINQIHGNSILLFLCKYLSKADDGKAMPKKTIEFMLEILQNLKLNVSEICLAELEESTICEWPFIIKWYENIISLKALPFAWKEDSKLLDAAYYTSQLINRHGHGFMDKIYHCLTLYPIQETLFLSAIKRLYTGSLAINVEKLDKVRSLDDTNIIFGDRTPCRGVRTRESIFSIMKTSGNTSVNNDNCHQIKNILKEVDTRAPKKSLMTDMSDCFIVNHLLYLTESDIKIWSHNCKHILKYKLARFDDLLPEMVVVIDRAIHLKKQFRLRDAQKVSIIAFLIKLNDLDKGKLQQISTGEGKTLVVVAISIIKALLNEKVDIITSSSVLAKRDSRMNKDVFDLFNVSVSNNCSENINDRREAYLSDVVYGEIGSFQRDILITEFYDNNIIGGRSHTNIVVDEVDSMLLDRGDTVLYLSHEIAGINAIEFVFVYIWSFVNAKNMTGTDEDRRSVRRCILDAIYGIISVEDIRNCSPVESDVNVNEIWKILTKKGIVDNEGRLLTRRLTDFEKLENDDIDILRCSNLAGYLINLLKDIVRKGKLVEVPHFLEEFVNLHLDTWIKNAFQAKYMKEGKDFVIDIDRTERSRGEDVNIVIMDNDTGQELYHMQWNCGLHQFLQLKYKCSISLESLKAVFMSNISFFRMYENLYGLTGTLGSTKERDLLREMYNVSYITIPTFQEPRFVEHDTILCTSTDGWLNSISETAILLSEKRPVLVICETIHSCCKIEKEFKRRNIDAHVYKNSYCELHVLDNELNSGCIIIATNLAGRGTDIRIDDAIDSLGGLHVILSYLPSNLRIEEQAFGRAARKGQNGSGQLIIFDNVNSRYRIKDVFTVSGLKVKRDTFENKRISKIQQRYENFIQVEENLFKEFQKYYNVLRRKLDKKSVDKEFQHVILQASLDRWAFWLDSAGKSLKHPGMHQAINYSLSRFLKEIDVSGVRHDSKKMMLMLQSPSQLVKAGKAKMLTKDYGMAQTFFKYVVDNYPLFSESALYYTAYCLLKKGGDDQHYEIVKSTLEQCTCLLRQREEKIRNEVQIVNFISSQYTDRRDSVTLSNGFQRQKDNAMQIFYQILDSIDDIIGHTIDPDMFIDTTCNLFNANMIFKDLETVHILSPEKVRAFPLDDYSWSSIKACYELYCTEIHTRIEQLKERSRVHMKDFADILPSREEFWRILIDKGILLDTKEFILVHEGEMQRCYKFLPKFVIDCLQSLTLNRERLFSKEYIFLYAEQKETIIAQTSILVPIETFKKTVGYSFILNILQKEKIISYCSVASLSLGIEDDVSYITLSKFDHIERKSFIEIGVTEETSCKIFNQLVKLKIISKEGKLLTQELGRVWLSPLSKYTTEVRNVLAKYFKYRLCLLYLLREKDIPLDLLSHTHELLFRDLVDANIITSVKTKSDTPKTNEKEKLKIIYDLKNKKNQFPRILESELMSLCVNTDFTAEGLKQKLIQNGLCKKCEQNTEGCLEIIVKYETLTETSEEQKLRNLGNEVGCFIINRLQNSFNLPSIVKQLERWKVGLYKFENTDTELKAIAECLTEEDQIVLYKDILTMTNNGFGEIFFLVERKWTHKSVFKIFCILAIGFIQVGIAMAVEFYSVGTGTFIANSLLSEGIGDIMFAVECLISGHCTIHSYLSHKTLSLTISALTGGVACMVARGAKFSRFGHKTGRQFLQRHSRLMKAGVSKTLLAKTTAKRIAKQIVNVTSMRIIDKGIDCYLGNILRRSLVELVDIRQNIIVSPDREKTLKETIISLARKLRRQDAKVLVEKCMDKCLLFRESDSSLVLYKLDTIAYAFSHGLRDGLEKLEYTEYSRDYWLYHTATICNLLAGGIEVKNAYDAIQSFKMSILDYFEHEIQTDLSFRHNFEEEQEGELEEAWASEQLNNAVKIANTEINRYFEMQIESIIIKPMFQIIGSKMSKVVYKRVCQLYHYGKDRCKRRTFDNLKRDIESERKQISPQMEDNIKNEYSKKLIKLLKETRNPSLFADIVEEGIPIDIHSVQAVAEITGMNIVIETIGADSFTMPHKFTPYGNHKVEEVNTIQLKYHFNTETGASHFETVNTSENQLHSSKCLLEAAMNQTGKNIDRKFLSETIRTHPDIYRNIKRGLHEFFYFQSDISCVLTKNPEPSEIIEKGHLLSKYKHQRDDIIVTELRNRSMSVTLENKKMIWKELKIHSLGEEFEIQKQIKKVESFFGSLAQNPKRSHASENRTGLFNASLHVNKIADTCVETSLNYVNPTEVYFGNKHEYVDNLQVFYNCRFDTRFALSNNRGMIWGHPNALHSKCDMHSTGHFCYSHQQLIFESHHKSILIDGKRDFLKHQTKVWEDKGNHLFIMLNGIKERVERLPTKTQLQQIDLSNWCSGLGHDLASHNGKGMFINGIEQEKYKLCVVAEHLITSNKKTHKSFSDKTRHEECQMKQFEQDFSNLQKTLSINESIKKIVKDTVKKANSLITVGNIMKTPVSDLIPKETTETAEPGNVEVRNVENIRSHKI